MWKQMCVHMKHIKIFKHLFEQKLTKTGQHQARTGKKHSANSNQIYREKVRKQIKEIIGLAIA